MIRKRDKGEEGEEKGWSETKLKRKEKERG